MCGGIGCFKRQHEARLKLDSHTHIEFCIFIKSGLNTWCVCLYFAIYFSHGDYACWRNKKFKNWKLLHTVIRQISSYKELTFFICFDFIVNSQNIWYYYLFERTTAYTHQWFWITKHVVLKKLMKLVKAVVKHQLVDDQLV